MVDVVSPKVRSRMMAGIRGQNTAPELAVRKMLHAMGYRFRLHRRDLPGSPDIVLPKYKTAIQVHGCYWHRHPGCRYASTPSSNVEFWLKKFDENVARDQRQQAELELLGWRVVVIWECETRDLEALEGVVRHRLTSD
jgi:DNA mismatch endonuclease (patch repair protein)